MAIISLIPRVTTITLTYLLIISTTTTTTAVNVTKLLSSFPNLSTFASLLSTTGVADELSHRTSLTLLAVPNTNMAASEDLTRHLSPSSLADLLRYHVLLQFLSWRELYQIPPSGVLVTTLFQTTGRAASNSGSVNVTRDPVAGSVTVHSPSSGAAPYTTSNATILSLIKTMPYNITVLAMDSLLVPSGFDLMASETHPPMGLNITEQLINGHDFNVAASMLSASGVEGDFESDERGAGITLFVPTDSAFADLPDNVKLQSLSADKKAVVLKFHVLHSYYPLGSLESIVNPLQPTIATESKGAGSYTLNISRINGSVAINTGIIQASVTRTVFDQNPVAIFGVSKVLLPREIFGKDPTAVTGKTGNTVMGAAQSPDISLSPENSPGLRDPPSHISSPPGFRDDIRSGSGSGDYGLRSSSIVLALCCIGLYLVV